MRRMLPVAVLAVLAAVVLLARGDADHTLRATFTEAVQVVPGQEVRIAGRTVGKVDDVQELDGDAVVTLHIDDDDWPLRRGTTARLRYGSLGGYAARVVDLTPGPRSAPPLPDGGVLGPGETVTPVEFDEIFGTFDRGTRADLRGVLDQAGDTLGPHGRDLATAIRDGGAGLDGYAGLVHDLSLDPGALRTLVRTGSRTAGALRAQDTALRALLTRAAGTIDELAAHADAQRRVLAGLPGTLRTSVATLARLERSIGGLRALVGDLAPGARRLAAVAPVVQRTVAALDDVAPRLTSALHTGRRTAPAIDGLLRRATTFLPRASSVAADLAPMLGCIRPYAPEIAGTASTWVRFSGSDAEGAYGRVDLTQPLPSVIGSGSLLTSAQVTKTFNDRVFYAMPRPPGLDAGQPWLQPQCSAGKDALDPEKDPERGTGR